MIDIYRIILIKEVKAGEGRAKSIYLYSTSHYLSGSMVYADRRCED